LIITASFLVILPLVLPILMPEEWNLAIKTGMILAPCLGMTLVAFPLNSVFTVYKMHQYLFYNQLAYFLIAVIAFGLAYWGVEYLHCVAIYSAFSSIRYIVLYIKANSIIKQKMSLA